MQGGLSSVSLLQNREKVLFIISDTQALSPPSKTAWRGLFSRQRRWPFSRARCYTLWLSNGAFFSVLSLHIRLTTAAGTRTKAAEEESPLLQQRSRRDFPLVGFALWCQKPLFLLLSSSSLPAQATVVKRGSDFSPFSHEEIPLSSSSSSF